MNFYQAMQLGAANLKPLIKKTEDKKESAPSCVCSLHGEPFPYFLNFWTLASHPSLKLFLCLFSPKDYGTRAGQSSRKSLHRLPQHLLLSPHLLQPAHL